MVSKISSVAIALRSPTLLLTSASGVLTHIHKPGIIFSLVAGSPGPIRASKNQDAMSLYGRVGGNDHTTTTYALQEIQKSKEQVQQAENRRTQTRQEVEGAVERLEAAEAAARAEVKQATDFKLLKIFAFVGGASLLAWAGGCAEEWSKQKYFAAEPGNQPGPEIRQGTLVGAGVLIRPRSVAIDAEGRIVVSDADLNQIIVFNGDGSVARRIGSSGSSEGKFISPHGVAVDQQGHIVVADSYNNRIQVLNGDGSVVHCFGSHGTAAGMFSSPAGVAINRDGHIIVADSGNHRVQVFTAQGSFLRQFDSEFSWPSDVAVDGAGRIVVTDEINGRVQVFSTSGEETVDICFGSCGREPGQLKRPVGIAIDGQGRFVVSDCGNHRIQVFDSDGSFDRVIKAPGGIWGQLKDPTGVAVDGSGNIIVVDQGNSRVRVL